MTPQSESVLEIFRSSGAYLEGHFRLTSGLHSGAYLQCALVLQHPGWAEQLGRMLAGELRRMAGGEDIETVAAPALGGLIVGHEVARALGARFVFSERDPATRQMLLRRGFALRAGEAAVVVEDVITTGGSTQEVVDLLRADGVRVLGAGSIIDRSGGQAALRVPRCALATLRVTAYEPAACPLCKSGVPIVKPGSRPV